MNQVARRCGRFRPSPLDTPKECLYKYPKEKKEKKEETARYV